MRARSAVLVVSRSPSPSCPRCRAALAACEAAGVRFERYVKGPGEPSLAPADEAAAAGAGADAVVGIGGGSALDLAKAARVVLQQGGPVARFLAGATALEPQRTALVLIPTTSGTGCGGLRRVRADRQGDRPQERRRRPAHARHTRARRPAPDRRPAARPDRADGHRCARAGDRRHHRAQRQPALAGHRARGRAPPLGGACRAPSRTGAISRRAASMALGSAARRACDEPLGLLGRPLARAGVGSRCGLPHGLTIGLVLAETLTVSSPDCAARLERVADALGEPEDGSGDGTRAVRGIRRILAAIAFPTAARGRRRRRAGRRARAARNARSSRTSSTSIPTTGRPTSARRLPRGVRAHVAVIPDNHNHVVFSGDVDAMLTAAEAAGLDEFAFCEHVFHFTEMLEAEPYFVRWTKEGPPIPHAHLRRASARRREPPPADGALGVEMDARPDEPIFEARADAFRAAYGADWDLVIGSVHVLRGDHCVQDEPIPLSEPRPGTTTSTACAACANEGRYDIISHPARLAFALGEPARGRIDSASTVARDAAASAGVALEVNGNDFWRRRPEPVDRSSRPAPVRTRRSASARTRTSPPRSGASALGLRAAPPRHRAGRALQHAAELELVPLALAVELRFGAAPHGGSSCDRAVTRWSSGRSSLCVAGASAARRIAVYALGGATTMRALDRDRVVAETAPAPSPGRVPDTSARRSTMARASSARHLAVIVGDPARRMPERAGVGLGVYRGVAQSPGRHDLRRVALRQAPRFVGRWGRR